MSLLNIESDNEVNQPQNITTITQTSQPEQATATQQDFGAIGTKQLENTQAQLATPRTTPEPVLVPATTARRSACLALSL